MADGPDGDKPQPLLATHLHRNSGPVREMPQRAMVLGFQGVLYTREAEADYPTDYTAF